MAVYFVDSSALVKRYINEVGSVSDFPHPVKSQKLTMLRASGTSHAVDKRGIIDLLQYQNI